MQRESGVEKVVIAEERSGSDATVVGVKIGSGNEGSVLVVSSMVRDSMAVVVSAGVVATASTMGVSGEGGVDGMEEYISPPFVFLLPRSE